jgi:hypothetical protein
MGIDEFDEFHLPVPPLDDDPFASLSATDLVVMEAAADDDANGSSSEYEEEEGDDNDKDYDEWFASLSSFFSLFGALMPKGEKSLSIYLSHVTYHFYLDLACKTLIYVWIGRVDMF